MNSVIEQIEVSVNRIAANADPRVKPGQPERFTEAATVNDCLRQGDLYVVIAENRLPAGYVKIAKPKAIDKQLVPGNTEGAKHCLDSLAGVELWRPENWNTESMEGPYMKLSQERTILHPTHGAITIPAGFAVHCIYQREFDQEQKREMRARD